MLVICRFVIDGFSLSATCFLSAFSGFELFIIIYSLYILHPEATLINASQISQVAVCQSSKNALAHSVWPVHFHLRVDSTFTISCFSAHLPKACDQRTSMCRVLHRIANHIDRLPLSETGGCNFIPFPL